MCKFQQFFAIFNYQPEDGFSESKCVV